MDKEDVVHIYNGILLSHKKKHEIMPLAATWTDLEIVILNEVRERQTSYDHCTWNLKMIQMNYFTEYQNNVFKFTYAIIREIQDKWLKASSIWTKLFPNNLAEKDNSHISVSL